MEIDIIDYTEDRLATLNKKRFSRVLNAQLRKNRLLRNLEKELNKERDRLIANGTFVSDLFALTEEKLYKACEEEIEVIKAELEAYLQETAPEDSAGGSPYIVDYNLPPNARIQTVKSYYLNTYVDAKERFYVFQEDKVAVDYLGEYYASVYDFFLALASESE